MANSRITPALAAARGRRALMKACEVAGSQNALARVIGRKQSTIWDWLNTGVITDVESVLKIEAATGVSRHSLRPDLSAVFSPSQQQHTRRQSATVSRGGLPARR